MSGEFDLTSINPEYVRRANHICFHGGYMYGPCATLEELAEVLNTEWEDEKHLVM